MTSKLATVAVATVTMQAPIQPQWVAAVPLFIGGFAALFPRLFGGGADA